MNFMRKIWSDNVYVNTAINCLLFLTGINFLHYGQLFLPVICLILFIDNKLVFKVNQPKVFILLCLFAVSFYAFSYQLGFYSVMGFTLPMTYYIGSNVKFKSEDNVRKLFYLVAFSMAMHVILNAVYEFVVHGVHGFFYSSSHYDIWVGDKVSSTLIAIDIDIAIACLYYLLFHEKNRRVKLTGLIVFSLSMFYLIIIGRRTQTFLLLTSLLTAFVYETFFLKTIDQRRKKQFAFALLIVSIVVILCFLVYSMDLFGLQETMDKFRIIQKLKQGLLGDERVDVFIDTIRLMPQYPFGGQKISSALNLQAHNFWLDIYDYAGIVPFVLIILHTINCVKLFIKALKNKKLSGPFKILCLTFAVCIFIQFNLEPVMTGASIFMIMTLFIITILDGFFYE